MIHLNQQYGPELRLLANQISLFFEEKSCTVNVYTTCLGKILCEKLFHTLEIPRSGSKAEDGERKRERAKVGDNNGQATHGARKHAWRTQAAWAKKMPSM